MDGAVAAIAGMNEAGKAMTKLEDLKARFMEDPEFRREYARADEEYALVEALVRARTEARLTQAELARRLGTTQFAVARLKDRTPTKHPRPIPSQTLGDEGVTDEANVPT